MGRGFSGKNLHTAGESAARNAKTNFTPVNVREVLARVAELPTTRCTFKDRPDGPHMGPMAQDFHAAFGLGGSDTTIATVDPDGVALAAIEALKQKVEEKAPKFENSGDNYKDSNSS